MENEQIDTVAERKLILAERKSLAIGCVKEAVDMLARGRVDTAKPMLDVALRQLEHWETP